MTTTKSSAEDTNFQPKESVKVVGKSGQISLGKEFAGRTVLVQEREPGVWHICTAQVVPDNERWLTPEAVERIQEGVAWHRENRNGEITMQDSLEQLKALKQLLAETP